MSAPETYDLDGLDKRDRLDRFAAAALTGMMASHRGPLGVEPHTTAQWAYDYAEAMEAERERRESLPRPLTPAEEAWEKSTRNGEDAMQEGQ